MRRMLLRALIPAVVLAQHVAAVQAHGQHPCNLSSAPTAVLGKSPGPEFGFIRGAAFVGDTILAVADRTSSTVTFYSLSGEVVAQYGRDGEGPGEFRSITQVSAIADSVVVHDRTLGRASILTTSGFERSFESVFFVHQVFPSGDLVLVQRGARAPAEANLWQDTINILLRSVRKDDHVVTRVPGERRIMQVFGGFSVYDAPFTAKPSIATNEEQIVVADGSGIIRRFSARGEHLRSVRSPIAARELTASDHARWIQDIVSRSRVPEDARRLLSMAPRVDRSPAHGNVALDRLSTVWLQDYRAPYETEAAEIVAFDSNSQEILRSRLPGRLRLLAASPIAVAFLSTDELDVSTVAVYAVTCRPD